MASLCSESSRPYSGRSASVPVSRACPKGGATGVTRLVRAEVSRGHSTDPPRPMETGRAEGNEQVRIAVSSPRHGFDHEPPYGDQSRVALLVIQWLGSKRQRGDLKLVLNRLVRTRMLGGVGGAPGNRAPIPMYARHGRELMGCKSPVRKRELNGGMIPNVNHSI